ncbi:filamentous hemagglutinin N-terminal domain-containing protein, partial [Magnetospirillum aberrantis]
MSPRRSLQNLLSSTLCAALLLQPMLAYAGDGIVADPAAQQRPGVGQATNGVPLVNIVAPNGTGLSHNKFSDYNVGAVGVVLNNSAIDGVSKLGGVVLANPNLVGHGQASTILAEVTSANRSRLEGFTEIFGGSADFILANPNGVTCNGCGFINSPRVTLTTGTPQIDGAGRLVSLMVRQGDISVGGGGLNANGIDVLDLISRSVVLEGAVNAHGLNVVAGRNDMDYATRVTTTQAGDEANAPSFAIDSSALGGMYADRISLLATERGVGVNMLGEMAANAGELRITADGRLALRATASATGDMALASQSGGVTIDKQVASGGSLSVAAATDVTAAGNAVKVIAAGNVDVNAESADVSAAEIKAGGDMSVTTAHDLNARDATLSATGTATVRGANVDLTRAKVAADTVTVTADATLAADAALTATTAQISAGRSITLSGSSLSADGAIIAAGQGGDEGQASLAATGGASIHNATVTSHDSTHIAAGGALDATGGAVQSAGDVTLGGSSVTLDGARVAAGIADDGSVSLDGTLSVTTAGILSHGDDALLTAGSDVVLDVGTLDGGSQSQGIQAARDVQVTATASANTTGGIQAGRDVTLSADTMTASGGAVTAGRNVTASVGSLDNFDTISAVGGVTLTASAVLGNETGAVISAGGTTQLDAPILVNAGRISAQGEGKITADILANSGSISARDDLTLSVTAQMTNQGLAFAGKQLKVVAAGTVTNDGGTLIGATGLSIDNGDTGAAGTVENVSGTIQAGLGDGTAANLSIKAGQIINRKKAFAVTTVTEAAPLESYTDHSISYEIQQVSVDSEAPKILADGAITLDGDSIANDQGLIHANGDMTLRGGSLTNSAPVLTTTRIDDVTHHYVHKVCTKKRAGVCTRHEYRDEISYSQDRQLQANKTVNLYGTIETAGLLTAQFTGTVANVGVVQGVPLYGLVAGSPEDSVRGVAFDARFTPVDGPLVAIPPADAAGLYVRTKDPLANYLVETDPVLSNLGAFYGSDYFLQQAGIDTNDIARRLGDSAYETKLVRDAVFAETGKRYLSPAITSDAAQMQALLDNAVAERTALNLSFGVSLSADQIAALTHDIVWFEEVEVDGQTMLAPHLYLARVSRDNIAPQSAGIIATTAAIQAAQVVNSGAISTSGALKVASAGDVVNQGGVLAAGTTLDVTAADDVLNLSGGLKGDTVTVSAGRDVVASTAVTTVEGSHGSDGIMHQQASVTGNSAVSITAGRDVATAGAAISSG